MSEFEKVFMRKKKRIQKREVDELFNNFDDYSR